MGDVLLPRLITDGQILHLYANLQAVPSHHETLRASHQRLKDTEATSGWPMDIATRGI